MNAAEYPRRDDGQKALRAGSARSRFSRAMSSNMTSRAVEGLVEIHTVVDAGAGEVVGRKLHATVESKFGVLGIAVGQRGAKVNFTDASTATIISQNLRRFSGIGQFLRSVHDQDRCSIESEITSIQQIGEHPLDEAQVVVGTVFLGYENLMFRCIPCAGALLVGPAQSRKGISASGSLSISSIGCNSSRLPENQ